MRTRAIFHAAFLVSFLLINYTQVSGQGYSFKDDIPIQVDSSDSPSSSAYTQGSLPDCNNGGSNAEYRLRGSQDPSPPAMPSTYVAPEPRHRPESPQTPEAVSEYNSGNPPQFQGYPIAPEQNPPQYQLYPVIPVNPPQIQYYPTQYTQNLPQPQQPQQAPENPPQYQPQPQQPQQKPENPPQYQPQPQQPQRTPENPPQYQPQPQQPQQTPENPPKYQPQPQQPQQTPENPPQYQPQPQQPQQTPENPPQYQPQPQQPQKPENPPQYQPQPQQPQRTPENPPQYQPQPQQPQPTPKNPHQPQPQQPQQTPENPPQSENRPQQKDDRTGKSLPQPPAQNQNGVIQAPTNPYAQPLPVNNNQLSNPSPDQHTHPAELTQLLSKLNNKIKDLEETQEALNKNIDELQEKLARRAKINTTASSLKDNKPAEAVEGWKELKEKVESPQDLQNVTNEVVSEACDQNTAPQLVLDFVHQIPADPAVKDSAYRTVADKMEGSEGLQEQMYWKEMTPYCQQVAQDIGPASPTTSKMLTLQDQMRLQAAKPIKECTGFIGQQEYQPAVMSWTNMTADIPDNSTQLNTNMEKIVTKAYGGNPENIQYVFYFIIVLPQSQNEFREVAYNCLQREMSANGHFYDPNTQTGGQVQQLQGQQTQQVPYIVGHVKK